MKLGALCRHLLPLPAEWESLQVEGIAYDSRNVHPGDLFVAVQGAKQDGSDFVSEAVKNGAAVVVTERRLRVTVPFIRVENSRKALAALANRFYGALSEKLPVVGITGTNGKTTTAFFIESIFRQAGMEPGLMGTILYRWKNREFPAPRTTPESVDIHRMLRGMVDDGVKSVVMEVSSHALALDRVSGMVFKAAVFTNLTQDHLDFHGTLEAYGQSKAALFRMVAPDGVAVVNADDPHADSMRRASSARAVSFGSAGTPCDYSVQEIRHTEDQTRFVLSRGGNAMPFSIRLWGTFNVMNAAAAAVCGLELGIDETVVRQGLYGVLRVPGRMDGIASGLGFRIVIDYAHTPDALENVLTHVRGFTRGKIIAVFGCGGDRDKGKRPLMGGIAARLADRVIVTSDNPRSENPEAIIRDILNGMHSCQNSEVITDRKSAIQKALEEAREGDTVVIAGKGHETIQDVNGKKLPFDDRLVATGYLKRLTET